MRQVRVMYDPIDDLSVGCFDGVQLPKQLALHRGGLQIQSVLVHQTRLWWFDVRITGSAFWGWQDYRHRHKIIKFEHQWLCSESDLYEGDVLVCLCLQHDIAIHVAMSDETLHDFIEWMPQRGFQLEQARSQLNQLWDDLNDWAIGVDLSTLAHKWHQIPVEQPTHDEARWRDYYCYEIWDEERPIYVGKGKGSRCASHLEKPEFQHFDELTIKVTRHVSEASACADELRRVEDIGLDNLKNKIMPSGRPSA